jgi:hypothetical protein
MKAGCSQLESGTDKSGFALLVTKDGDGISGQLQ